MSASYLMAVVFGMFAVTFAIRFILLARAHRTHLPLWLEEALRFVPVAVLTAIIMPMMFMPNKTFELDWHNAWLLGGGAAFVTGLVLKKPMVTIVVGVGVFFLSKWWIL